MGKTELGLNAPGIKPGLSRLLHSQADSLPLVPLGKPTIGHTQLDIFLLALRNTLLFLALYVSIFSFVKSGEMVCTSWERCEDSVQFSSVAQSCPTL